jgi:hypothetical protein
MPSRGELSVASRTTEAFDSWPTIAKLTPEMPLNNQYGACITSPLTAYRKGSCRPDVSPDAEKVKT